MPPKRGLCPEEITTLGTTGVQIEAKIGVCQWYFYNFCGLTPDFWDEDLFFFLFFFFLEITCFRSEKLFNVSGRKTVMIKTV